MNHHTSRHISRKRVRLGSLIVLLATLAMGASAQRIHVPPTKRETLDNGLTILLMEYKKVPMVQFRLVARGGSADDLEGQEGVASMMAALMRQGTSTRSATDLAKAIDFMGGSLTPSAGLDYCAVNAQVLKKDTDAGLDLFADVILNPTFPDEEIERERKQRLAGLEALKEEPRSLAGLTFNKMVYGSHPYSRQTAGTKASLKYVTHDRLLAFYNTTFLPNNSILVVVGDFDSAEMFTKLRTHFAAWKRGTREEGTHALPVKVVGRKVVVVDKPDATQAQIQIGNVGVDIKHPDNFAIDVANGIFGNGFTSRLVDALRVKKSLTYGASSNFPSYLHGGKYIISTFTKNETLGEAMDVVLDELKKFRDDGARNDEVKKARNYLSGDFARSLQTPEALASNLSDVEFYGFPKDYVETYIQKLQAVSPADVKRVVQQYFLLDDLVMVIVAPSAKATPVLQKYGPVSVMQIEDVVQ